MYIFKGNTGKVAMKGHAWSLPLLLKGKDYRLAKAIIKNRNKNPRAPWRQMKIEDFLLSGAITPSLKKKVLNNLERLSPTQRVGLEKYRPKKTKEVSLSSKQDENSPLHGGDGNSKEVDSISENPDSGIESKEFEPNSVPKKGLSAAEKKALEKLYTRKKRVYGSGRSGEGSSWCPQLKQPVNKGDLGTIKNAMERFFKDVLGNPGDLGGWLKSPRIDSTKLLIEKMSKRWNLSRILKEELETKPRTVIVAADCSGSCSSSSGYTTALCEGLTHIWPELYYVLHGNGVSCEVYNRGKRVDMGNLSDSQIWQSLSENCVGALFLGDTDGFDRWSQVWTYGQSTVKRVIWLDSYNVRNLDGKPTRKNYVQEPIPGNGYWEGISVAQAAKINERNKNVLVYYQGVNNPESVAYAIRQELR